jgi:6-phosphogluconolactonase
MTMAWHEYDHPDGTALAEHLATMLCAAMESAIESEGGVVVALAGGRTPFPAYRRLATMPLDWSRVVLLPTDERCVPHDHPACNVRELREAFADAPGVRIESLTVADGDPEASEAHARAVLAGFRRPLDVVVLGMGLDAHTASLFPGASQLPAATNADDTLGAYRIDPDPLPAEAPFPRITLSLRRLLDARELHLALSGEAKRHVLRHAQTVGRDPNLPITEVLHAPRVTVDVHWSP